jgi:23S rRNA (adenine2503-C2)-methyltransferase
MHALLREQAMEEYFKDEPTFRVKQAVSALFQPEFSSWDEVSSLPKILRESLTEHVPWSTLSIETVLGGKWGDTWKALLRTEDGMRIETVLMENRREAWTVCVSSQVGCAMNCSFCATGQMGFTRNLSADEIVDQVRFWKGFLKGKPDLRPDITNIVYMGMGEPLANYDNVKQSLSLFTDMMGIGMTRITVSTVGLVPMLEKLLEDEAWPPVRLAVSLHSANPGTRKDIMPTSYDEFLAKLAGWAEKYFAKFDTNRRHLTFEYVLLSGINDTAKHANALVRFARRVGKVKVNLIPYNYTTGEFRKSSEAVSAAFQGILSRAGVTVTRRKTMGDDIAAACGQLAAGTPQSTKPKDTKLQTKSKAQNTNGI